MSLNDVECFADLHVYVWMHLLLPHDRKILLLCEQWVVIWILLGRFIRGRRLRRFLMRGTIYFWAQTFYLALYLLPPFFYLDSCLDVLNVIHNLLLYEFARVLLRQHDLLLVRYLWVIQIILIKVTWIHMRCRLLCSVTINRLIHILIIIDI